MSPLQQLLRRPEEEEGNVSVRVEPGLVIVTYRNFSAAIDY